VFNFRRNEMIKYLSLIALIFALASCVSTEAVPTEIQEKPTTPPTDIPVEPTAPPTETSSAPRTWPEKFNFCREMEGEAEADCWSLTSVEDWLALPPQVGDEFWTWPEFMDLPPLPEGLKWKRQRDSSTGESYWVVVET
jgi:hypothetical protein